MNSKLDAILDLLRSNEFRCSGSRASELAYRGYNTPEQDMEGSYDSRGFCTNTVRILQEREYGELGSLLGTDMILDAPCAAYHHLDDDSPEFHYLVSRFLERRYLLKQVEQLLK